jgi:hypothetical protein
MAPCMTLATAFFREYLGTRRLICLSTGRLFERKNISVPENTLSRPKQKVHEEKEARNFMRNASQSWRTTSVNNSVRMTISPL